MVMVACVGHLALHLLSSIRLVGVSGTEKRQVETTWGNSLWLQDSVAPEQTHNWRQSEWLRPLWCLKVYPPSASCNLSRKGESPSSHIHQRSKGGKTHLGHLVSQLLLSLATLSITYPQWGLGSPVPVLCSHSCPPSEGWLHLRGGLTSCLLISDSGARVMLEEQKDLSVHREIPFFPLSASPGRISMLPNGNEEEGRGRARYPRNGES